MADAHDDLERLRALLSDPDPDVRGLTAVALARLAIPEARDMLMQLLADSDSRVVCAAVQSLGDRGDQSAVPALVDVLNRSQDVDVECSVLSSLAMLKDHRAFSAVVVKLFDADDEVRRNAAATIGYLKDKRALVPLYELLADDYSWVRANAALSIGTLGDVDSVDHLMDLLARETDDLVRANALIAIGQCDPSKEPLIVERLLDAGEQERARVSACIALAEMAEKDELEDEDAAVTALIDMLGDTDAPDEVRASSAWALGRMQPAPRITDAFLRSLHDEYRWVVFYALEGIALHKDTSALPALRAFRVEREDEHPDHVDALMPHIDDAIRELEGDPEDEPEEDPGA